MALMLIAAVIIGLAYNSITPLGVVFGATTATPPDSDSAPAVQNRDAVQFINASLKTGNVFGQGTFLLAKGPGRKNLTWPETKALLAGNEIVLVDARDAIAYQTEHIPGAISLPATSTKAQLADFASKYPPDTALVIYCNSKRCPLGHDLAKTLRSQWHYTNIRLMPGGFAEYRAAQVTSQR